MGPTRIVLSRRSGFNLQAHSRALNGLAAQSVSRPGRWGNPFAIADVAAELGLAAPQSQTVAVERFAQWIVGRLPGPKAAPLPAEIKMALASKNLACWCPAGTPCHAQVLLELANE